MNSQLGHRILGAIIAAFALQTAVAQEPAAPPPSPYVAFKVSNPEVKRAMEAVAAAVPVAAADERRPRFHFHPPAQWNNDPNGPFYKDGLFHMFYQQNPYGDRWDHMHWGHARSKDLVHWEHLPIALWPSTEKGENHCFSGCATTTPAGGMMLIYTSIGDRLPEQWAATPADKDFMTWEKHPANPIMTEALHGETKIHEWRDPYVFQHQGRYYLVTGGNLNASQGGQATVELYEAQNDELTQWKYRGILFTHPDADVKNIECPNFFPLDDRFVLIVSAHRAPEYFIGDFDAEKGAFSWKTRGCVDYGDYYAPNGCFDGTGGHILWGWIRGFDFAKGWNGCLSLPRKLSIDQAGMLVQEPAEELKALRTGGVLKQEITLDTPATPIPGLKGNQFELRIKAPAKTAFSINLKGDAPEPLAKIICAPDSLDLAGVRVPMPKESDALELRIFVDRCLLEVYINGGAQCVTRVFPALDRPVSVELERGAGTNVPLEFKTKAWVLANAD